MNFTHRKLQWPHESPNNLGFKLLLFLLWPFGAWIESLKSANTKSSYVIFFMFSLLICWHFEEPGYFNYYDDFIGIRDRFYEYNLTFDQIVRDFTAYINFADNAPKDIYERALNWFSKFMFGNNYHFFFLLAAIPIAICQTKVMKHVTCDSKFIARNLLCLVVLAMLIFPRDIVTVQNPRFSTGFWICVCASIYYYCNYGNKFWCLFFILLSPLFHSGLLVYVGLFFASIFIPKKGWYLETAAICSIPFIFFNADLLSSINIELGFLPHSIKSWIELHLSDDMYSKHISNDGRAGFWWIEFSFNIMMRFAYIYMTYLLIKNKVSIKNNEEIRNFYYFYLIVFTFANTIQFVPVLGTRYYWFIRIFCLFIWFKALYPEHLKSLYFLVFASIFSIIQRYGYILGGALACTTPLDLFFAPLPYLLGKGLLW